MMSKAEHEQLANSTLEHKLTDPFMFGLTTASPLQRAICRIADGIPLGELGEREDVKRAIGDTKVIDGVRPEEVAVFSAVRTGKSLTASAAGYHCSQTCDLSYLGPGEIPRVSIVSIKLDSADVIYQHLSGRLKESTRLRETLLEEPSGGRVLVRHPSGRPVEIMTVAGARAGASLVSRWSAGCIFDEFARMQGAADAVVNWDHSVAAIQFRLLRGAQLWHITSPWAPIGPAYDLVSNCWKRPSKTIVVIKAPGADLNPSHWTPERVAKAKETAAAKGKMETFLTDVMAEFADQDEGLFSAEAIEASMRDTDEDLPPEDGCSYAAAMDPATRGNGWTLHVTTRKGTKKILVLVREWRGSPEDPLHSRRILKEMAELLEPYGVKSISSDQYHYDSLVDHARAAGLNVVTARIPEKEVTERYLAIKMRMEEGELSLPRHRQLRADLVRLRKKVTHAGVKIDLPHSADGRHCDHAPPFMLSMSRYLQDVPSEGEARRNTESAKMLAYMKKRYGRKQPEMGWGSQ